MAQLLLHGTLDVTVYEADSLVDPRRLSAGAPKLLRRVGTLCSSCLISGVENRAGIGKEWGRLYATIDLERARVGRTRIIQQEPANPRWAESFHIYCAHQAANVVVSVKNDNSIGATLLGRARVPVADLLSGYEISRWFDLRTDEGRPVRGGGRVRLRLRFDANWAGRPLTPTFPGVPYTFFKQTTGCRVTLYQDAHAGSGFAPRILLSGGRPYGVRRCWEDVFDAICAARHFVYIAGWSVYTGIRLIRDPERPRAGGGLTLGELLKRRAEEGVRVLLLVWDDRTSAGGLLNKAGLMATHDEETSEYFKNTKVRCVLCPRNPDDGKSVVQGAEIATMFTHHQKTLVADAPGGREGRRVVVGFLGGIDLCDGRYDTQRHPLFGTLGSVHADDFHQPNFPGASVARGGPREPWHDVHSKVEGPVAWDVLRNFEQRWRKQAVADDDLLLPVEGIAPRSAATAEGDPQTWNVQLFRSIDGGAVAGFPDTPEGAAEAGLVSGKDSTIDRSIQDAYIHAIRRARSFVYVENQYFLGSSFAWRAEGDIDLPEIGALHLIPKELSLKIVSKIEAGERFCVYVVVPMWPEGAPESASVQAILDWQRRTMQMMYDDVAQALRARQMFDVNPKDYLSFFCLGNRETQNPDEPPPAQQPEADTDYKRAQDNRRFMIYVHSKMMIVDDEYIIVGSANINQSSMDGARDSEIAMGAYQPHQLGSGRQGSARGDIHGFRMSLWAEHTGASAPAFLEPQTLECMRYVNRIAQQNWEVFAGQRVQDLPGHLMSYPVLVTNDGNVSDIPSLRNFPDTKARILGARSDYLPPILTT